MNAQKSMYSQILYCVSAKFFNILNATKLGKTELREYEPRKATKIMMLSTESRRNSSGTSSQNSQRCSSVVKVSDLLNFSGQSPETFTRRILFMSLFNDISCDRYDKKDECLRNANFVKTFAGRFGIGQWSFVGPGCEKKCIFPKSQQGAWNYVAEEMLLKFAESGHAIFRSTTPFLVKCEVTAEINVHDEDLRNDQII